MPLKVKSKCYWKLKENYNEIDCCRYLTDASIYFICLSVLRCHLETAWVAAGQLAQVSFHPLLLGVSWESACCHTLLYIPNRHLVIIYTNRAMYFLLPIQNVPDKVFHRIEMKHITWKLNEGHVSGYGDECEVVCLDRYCPLGCPPRCFNPGQ